MSGASHDAIERELAAEVERYAHDPLGYVLFAFPWGEGELEGYKPRRWQSDVWGEMGEMLRGGHPLGSALEMAHKAIIREAIASGHFIGKSAWLNITGLWALSTLIDTRGYIASGKEDQLRTKTWPELDKWKRLCINGHWFRKTATALHSVDPEHEDRWRMDMMVWSEKRSEAEQGQHNLGKRMFFLFDEASQIPKPVWDAIGGSMRDADTEILWAAFGNPTRPDGEFRECFRGPERHKWRTRNIDSRTVEGCNKAELDDFVKAHGEDSDIVKVRVRGLFPSRAFGQFFDEHLVDAAYGRHLRPEQYAWAPKIISVDPASTGADELVISMRQGLWFSILQIIPYNDNDMLVGQIVARHEDDQHADAVFVEGGYGTGIVSWGQTNGRRWQIVWPGGESADPGCLNKRAEMHKLARQWLVDGGALPPDPRLRSEILEPHIIPRTDEKVQVESKKDMKARGVASPNRLDAWTVSFAYPVAPRSERDAMERGRQMRARVQYDELANLGSGERAGARVDEDEAEFRRRGFS